jgi:hypothetical protein
VFVKKIRQTSCDVFLTAREEEELKNRRRRKRKKCKNLSPSFFGFFFSLINKPVSSQSNNLHNFGDHNIA